MSSVSPLVWLPPSASIPILLFLGLHNCFRWCLRQWLKNEATIREKFVFIAPRNLLNVGVVWFIYHVSLCFLLFIQQHNNNLTGLYFPVLQNPLESRFFSKNLRHLYMMPTASKYESLCVKSCSRCGHTYKTDASLSPIQVTPFLLFDPSRSCSWVFF